MTDNLQRNIAKAYFIALFALLFKMTILLKSKNYEYMYRIWIRFGVCYSQQVQYIRLQK